MQAEKFFQQLWREYVAIAPQAQRIFDHVEAEFGAVLNDHVAFRSFDRPGYTIGDLQPAFEQLGYRRADGYDFGDKHLLAYSYLPPHDALPRIFLSQLLTDSLSSEAQQVITDLLKSDRDVAKPPLERLLSGRTWTLPTAEQYDCLMAESAYGAWLSVWGLCANHFTVAVHQLRPAVSLSQVVESLQAAGFEMNSSGGVIKGTPEQLLEQASTMAESQPVELPGAGGGERRVVGTCYYEFAQRHCDAQGNLYQGFVASSANHIFESTTVDGKEMPQ